MLRQRVNVSHCYGVTGLHSRLFDPVLGLKSFLKKKKMEASHELSGSANQLYLQCPLSFFLFILTYSLIFSLDFGFSSKPLITML